MPKIVATKKKTPAAKHGSKKTPAASSAARGNSKKVPILPCLANLHRAGVKVIPRPQVVTLSGYTKESLRVTLCKLRKQGLVDWDDAHTVRLTAAGWDKAAEEGNGHAAVAAVMTNEETHRRLKDTYKLTGTKGQIFDLLLDGAPHVVSRLMTKVGCTNADSFRVFVCALTSKNLAERIAVSGEKMIRLTDMCFPFGRPGEEQRKKKVCACG